MVEAHLISQDQISQAIVQDPLHLVEAQSDFHTLWQMQTLMAADLKTTMQASQAERFLFLSLC